MEEVKTVYDFDTSAADANIARTLRGQQALLENNQELERARGGQSVGKDMDKASKAAQALTKAKRDLERMQREAEKRDETERAALKKLTDQTSSLRKEAEDLMKAIQKEADAMDKAAKSTEKLSQQTEKAEKQTQKSGKGMTSMFQEIGRVVAAAFTIDKLIDFVKDMAEMGRQIEVQGIKITSALQGSVSAAKQYQDIIRQVDLASSFDNAQITEGVTKLLNRRILLTKDQLQSLANIGASIGTAGQQSFVQVVEAYLDALVGQYRRLEELGVGVNAQGDKLSLTFGGVTTVIGKSSSAIAEYILNLDKANNSQEIANQMAETAEGRLSALEGSYQQLAKTIGENGGNKLQSVFFDWVSAKIQSINKDLNSLGSLWDTIQKKIQGRDGGTPTVQRGRATMDNFIEMKAQQASQYAGTPDQIESALKYNRQRIRENLFQDDALRKEWHDYANKQEDNFRRIQDINRKNAPGLIKMVEDAGGVAKLTNEQIKIFNNQANRIAQASKKAGNTDLSVEFQRIQGELNQRTSEIQADERKAADKAEKDRDKARKTAESRARQAEAQEQDAKKRYLDELEKQEQEYNKRRVENLDKDSKEYIEAKRTAALGELEQERQRLLKLQNLANGTAKYNAKTGRTEVTPATATELENPAARQRFIDSRNEINSRFDAMGFQRDKDKMQKDLEDFYKQMDKLSEALKTDSERRIDAVNKEYEELLKIAGIRTKQYTALIQKRQKEIDEIRYGKIVSDSELAQRKAEYQAIIELTQKQGETEQEFEYRKQKKLFEIKKKAAEDQLDLLKKMGLDEKDERVLALRAMLKELGIEMEKADKEFKNRDRDIFDMLGLKVNDAQKEALTDASKLMIDTINSVLDAEIQASQQRIDYYNNAIQQKDAQIQQEIELAKEGKANNVATLRSEREELQKERDKAIADQRRDQKIQIALNAAMQASEMGLAIARTISNSATLGPIVGPIVAGIQIAAFIAMLVSSINQVKNLSQFREGGDVDLGDIIGPAHEHGGKKIEVEGGEFVAKRKQARKYNDLLHAINDDTLHKKSRSWLEKQLYGTGVSPLANEGVISLGNALESAKGDDRTYAMLKAEIGELKELMKPVSDHAKNQPEGQMVSVGDGRMLLRKKNVEQLITMKPKK